MNRYYTLINDERYRENNYYGHEAVPQLVICGESYEHYVKIDQYLRRRGLISETDSLLYTEDLFYVQQTLQTLYELDEEGNRTWYSLPAKQMVTDMEYFEMNEGRYMRKYGYSDAIVGSKFLSQGDGRDGTCGWHYEF